MSANFHVTMIDMDNPPTSSRASSVLDFKQSFQPIQPSQPGQARQASQPGQPGIEASGLQASMSAILLYRGSGRFVNVPHRPDSLLAPPSIHVSNLLSIGVPTRFLMFLTGRIALCPPFQQIESWDVSGTTISWIEGTHQNSIGSRMPFSLMVHRFNSKLCKFQ